jgi:hypothetical protein
VRLLQPVRNVLPRRVDGPEPERLRDRETLRQAIDGVDRRRTGRARYLREDQPDRPAAEDDRRAARVALLGVCDRVHRDREHLREVGAVLERQLLRQELSTSVGDREPS